MLTRRPLRPTSSISPRFGDSVPVLIAVADLDQLGAQGAGMASLLRLRSRGRQLSHRLLIVRLGRGGERFDVSERGKRRAGGRSRPIHTAHPWRLQIIPARLRRRRVAQTLERSALEIETVIAERHLPHGGVMDPIFTAPDLGRDLAVHARRRLGDLDRTLPGLTGLPLSSPPEPRGPRASSQGALGAWKPGARHRQRVVGARGATRRLSLARFDRGAGKRERHPRRRDRGTGLGLDRATRRATSTWASSSGSAPPMNGSWRRRFARRSGT